MTAPDRIALRPGMRVVVRDGPWPTPRVAGHYGKVVEVGSAELESGPAGEVLVDITGHVDGGEPDPMFNRDLLMKWFYADELEIVD